MTLLSEDTPTIICDEGRLLIALNESTIKFIDKVISKKMTHQEVYY